MVDENTKPFGEMVGKLGSTIAFTSPLQDMKRPLRDIAISKKYLDSTRSTHTLILNI